MRDFLTVAASLITVGTALCAAYRFLKDWFHRRRKSQL